jgi:hypothetical protein
MRSYKRTPEFVVSFVRPNYFSTDDYAETSLAQFNSDSTNNILIDYSYRNEIETFSSDFSMTLLPALIGNSKKTAMDYFLVNDVVKIYEFKKLKYVGIIKSLKYSARMDGNKPDRTIVISGYGVGGIIENFSLTLDNIVLASAKTNLDSINNSLITKLASSHDAGASMQSILNTIKDAYKTVIADLAGFQEGEGIWKVVDQYLVFSSDYSAMYMKYPFSGSLFSYDGNSLKGIWDMLVCKPLQEFFIRWEPVQKKYVIILRPTPFSPDAWMNLNITTLDPLYYDDTELEFSIDEIKTWFFAYMSGSSVPYEVARVTYKNGIIWPKSASLSSYDKTFLQKKWMMYGYKPLEVSFRFCDIGVLSDNKNKITIPKSGIKGDVFPGGKTVTDEQLMEAYSKQLYDWYKRMDEMLKGTIAGMTMENSPLAGERVYWHGSQFYVESVEGGWTYGGEMRTTLHVTRGGIYNSNFNTSSSESDTNWFFRKLEKTGNKIGITATEMQDNGV